MNRELLAAALSTLLACGLVALVPVASADPSNEDQVFFDNLAEEGLHPQYDKQICGSLKCESLRDLLVQEGHAVCSALSSSPRLVPVSVIANLEVTPDEAHAVIDASRRAYCPQSPDPYSRA
ncbi:DUF732 domain-containing protein [[Mycobacterium] nativiensis]|uniref:DUF732 domain-containing protein n=1 Tax=[Mycobacterium] nativiensis TaxID=2855503 RepID=A0ABU5XY41_9MYCO|nr:DUF732 domain-containing protein [Mycolicibacter sp. MYC340]MEB3032830.1 DUF732 domain-containing protein [Mycolicibacter sp. MYC340]